VPALATAGERPDTLLYLEGPEQSETSPSPTPSPTGDDEEGAEGSDLVAIDPADQTERWRVPLDGESRTGVTVDGDVAYVGDEDGTVTAVSIADGDVLWTKGLGSDGDCAAAAGVIDAPIASSDGLVVAVARDADEGIVAVSGYDGSDGSCRWRVASQIGSTAVSAPAAGDGQAIVGFADRTVRAIGAQDGVEQWNELVVSIFLPVSAPALGPEDLYMADVGGGLYRLDPETGERIWGYQLNERVLRSSPAVSGGTVLTGLSDGRLVAVDVGSGHLAWQSEPTPGLVGTIALSSDVVVAVKGGSDAGLISFEHDPAGVLVDVPSPAELDAPTTLGRLGIAAVVALVIVLAPGILARRRFGDAFAPGDEPDGRSEAAEGSE
jgi:outer membrane protein assembly factor BamB